MNKDTNKYLSREAEISNPNQPTLFSLSGFDKKKVEVKFTMEETSNDGEVLLLREIDKQVELINSLSNCIKDGCHQSYVEHRITSMLSLL
ncbi:MAG: transposase [Draconibacterium sp.]|nr:transposase [Draconibacterium sp.]